ncbi:MAG: dihydropteroate synthase [Rhodobacteraceae bacterium]|nr:dihydropteroate synthase [Paracoccaceae bacterium]
MTRPTYWRPIAETDAHRPKDALPLAGGQSWFARAERLSRDAPPELVPLSEVPTGVLEAITAPRPPIAGLDFDRPRLMAVLNVTPDSFSDGGNFDTFAAATAQAQALIAQGADILDIGGESTRPGAETVAGGVEISRVLPVIEAALQAAPVPISIDTRKAGVAAAALAAGAVLVNDVSALTHDPGMAALIAGHGAPVCLMHSRGDPKTMQDAPSYDNVLLDVFDDLEASIATAIAAGIPRRRIMVDPGIGFAKNQDHNLALIRGLSLLHGLGCAIILGVSRKGFIGRIGQEPQAKFRAPGSIALGLEGIRQGVQLLRVHDIAETRQAIALWQAAR